MGQRPSPENHVAQTMSSLISGKRNSFRHQTSCSLSLFFAMEKQWVEDVKKSPQFKCGLLHPYLDLFDFEKDGTSVEDSEFYDSDDSEDEYVATNAQQTVIKFLKQVRESRGYDVDIMVPRRFNSPFRPVYPEELESKDYKADVMRGLNFAMKNINAESEEVTGKTYEFVEFKKIVEVRNFIFLFTFTATVRSAEANDADAVKTLQAMVYAPFFAESKFLEWRVKPVPDATEGLIQGVTVLPLKG